MMLLSTRSSSRTMALLIGVVGLTPAARAQAEAGRDNARAAAADLMSDADMRGSMLRAPDKDITLNINGLVQMRYDLNFRKDVAGSSSDFANGFQNRRTQVIVSGNITKEMSYRIQSEFKTDGSVVLNDAFIQYKWDSGWAFKVGQFKPPLLREELVGDLNQLAAERSVVNSVFTQSRSQGVELNREFDTWRMAASFNDGLNASNTDIDSSKEADFGLTGRAEWKIAGDWKQFKDFSSWRGSEFGSMVGGAVHYQSGGETFGTTDLDLFEYSLDASVEGDGWNAYAAMIGRNRDEATRSFDDFGFILQGGVFVSPSVELFARYDLVLPDDSRGATGNTFNTISAGLSFYPVEKSHAAQFRFQTSWFLDAQSSSIVPTSTHTGVLADTKGDQVAVMFEFALQF